MQAFRLGRLLRAVLPCAGSCRISKPSPDLKGHGDANALDALSGSSVRDEGVSCLTRILAEFDHLESLGPDPVQSHLAHLRLASVAAETELYHGAAIELYELNDLIGLEDELVREEFAQGHWIDKEGGASDDEHSGRVPCEGLLAVLDAIVIGLDAESSDSRERGLDVIEKLLGRDRAEEDDFGGRGVVGDKIWCVDECTPDAADTSDRVEELLVCDVWGEIAQPESTILVVRQMVGACVAFCVHSVVAT